MEAAVKLYNRLTEVEKMRLRAASRGSLEHQADTAFQSDLPCMSFNDRVEIVEEVQAMCLLAYAEMSAEEAFGNTWKF